MMDARDPSSLPRIPPLLASPRGRGEGGEDLFALGRAAAAAARRATGGRGVFARSRRLLPGGVWRGPRDAADSYVEGADLGALGGLGAVLDGFAIGTCLATSAAVAREAAAAGLRVLFRVPYRAGEPERVRRERLDHVGELVGAGLAVDGVVPAPENEPLGLDSLAFFAHCRLRVGAPHVIADFALLGHRLAQMSLGFGADELLGPIVAERALRIGANSGNPALTRKEAAWLIRGAGLEPWERLAGGALESIAT